MNTEQLTITSIMLLGITTVVFGVLWINQLQAKWKLEKQLTILEKRFIQIVTFDDHTPIEIILMFKDDPYYITTAKTQYALKQIFTARFYKYLNKLETIGFGDIEAMVEILKEQDDFQRIFFSECLRNVIRDFSKNENEKLVSSFVDQISYGKYLIARKRVLSDLPTNIRISFVESVNIEITERLEKSHSLDIIAKSRLEEGKPTIIKEANAVIV